MAVLEIDGDNHEPGRSARSGSPGSDAVEPQRSGGAGRARRWARWELAVLAFTFAVLTAIAVAADTGFEVISDEGVVLAQAQHVLEGTWGRPLPVPGADPTGVWAPIDGSAASGGEYFPYVKHVAYPLAVAGATAVAGTVGPLLLSAWAVWLAALFGALIAARLDPRLRVPTLVVLAVGSPLVFDVGVVIAHGIGAALMGGLALSVLRWIDTGRSRWLVPAALAAVALTMFRSEGLLAVGALCVVLVVGAATGRLARDVPRAHLLAAGVLLGLCSIGAYVLDGWIAAQILVDEIRPYSTVGSDFDLVGGRVSSLWASMLNPSDQREPAAAIAFVSMLLTVCAALLVRSIVDSGLLRLAFAGAALTAVVASATGTGLVTGMLVAFPLLPAGLVLLRRDQLRDVTARLCLWTGLVGAVAIWLPSYAIGGSSEWGGRFYHLLLPLLVPVAMLALARAAATLTPLDARLAGAALAVVTLSMSVAALREQHDLRARATATVEDVHAAVLADAAPGDRPVVLTDRSGVGRYGWAKLDRIRLLTVLEPAQLADALDALHDAGVERVQVVVGGEIELPATAQDWQERSRGAIGTWTHLELVRS